MSRRCHFPGCLLIIGLVAGWASAGPLTGVNLLINGEFELDPAGSQVPTGWDLWTSAPAGWQGVLPYGCLSGHPKPRPDGQCAPSQVYGTGMVWYDTATGVIEQSVTLGQPGSGPAEVWFGGWIYCGSMAGAYVEFELEQGDTEWTSGQLFEPGDWSGWWSWFEQAVPTDYGFVAGTILCRVTINLAAEGHPAVGFHAMFVDGLELEGHVLVGPQATAWRSVRQHDDVGELAIVLDPAATGQTPETPTVETRRDGIHKLLVDFDQPVQLSGQVYAQDASTTVQYLASQVNLAEGDTRLEIHFEPGQLADQTCYVIDLAGAVQGAAGLDLSGDTDCMIRSLTGDINEDGRTNLADMALAKTMNGAVLDEQTAKFDVNLDGRINLADMALIKLLNGGAVTCP